MADGHLGLDLNTDGHLPGLKWPTVAKDITWPQKSILVYTINPELMRRSIVTDVHADVHIY